MRMERWSAAHDVGAVVAPGEDDDDADDLLVVDEGLAKQGAHLLAGYPLRLRDPGHAGLDVAHVEGSARGRDGADLVMPEGDALEAPLGVGPGLVRGDGVAGRGDKVQALGAVPAVVLPRTAGAGAGRGLQKPDAHQDGLRHLVEGARDQGEELLEALAAAHAQEQVVALVHAVEEVEARVDGLGLRMPSVAHDEGVDALADGVEHGAAAADLGAVAHFGRHEVDDGTGEPVALGAAVGVGGVVFKVEDGAGKPDGIGDNA